MAIEKREIIKTRARKYYDYALRRYLKKEELISLTHQGIDLVITQTWDGKDVTHEVLHDLVFSRTDVLPVAASVHLIRRVGKISTFLLNKNSGKTA